MPAQFGQDCAETDLAQRTAARVRRQGYMAETPSNRRSVHDNVSNLTARQIVITHYHRESAHPFRRRGTPRLWCLQ